MQPRNCPVYLVSCVSKKRAAATPARDLYLSSWFSKARRYAEVSGCPWFILSAEYGLVAADRVIEPYECTLNKMPVAERRAWAGRTFEALIAAAPHLDRVVILGGERYREFLAVRLQDRGVSVSVPMAGLGIGQQLQWLGRHTPDPAV